MEYIIDDEDVEQLEFMFKTYKEPRVALKAFLEMQQPVELVAEGKVELQAEGFEGSLTGVYLATKGRDIGLNDILNEDKAIELENNNIKIYIVEEGKK